MAVYTLDQALEIVFSDKDYYVSLSESYKNTFRSYRKRYKENKLTLDTKLETARKYGFTIQSPILLKLKA